MTITPTPMTAACDALLLRLLELEETADPARGRLLSDIGSALPDPLREWVREHAVQIRTTWLHQGWATEPDSASLGGNDAFVELTGAGRAYGAQVRELRAGMRRVLLFLYSCEEDGEPPFGIGALAEPTSPWAWLADRPLDWDRDIERATEYLDGQGMFTNQIPLAEAGIVMARLSHLGVQAVEKLLDGPTLSDVPGVGPQVVNIHVGDVWGSATVMQGRDVHGDVSGGRGLAGR